MKVLENINEWKKLRASYTQKTIGFVPTMGALHEGHLSLVRRSVKENDVTVVSIYINPTQFDNKDDLQKYPVTISEDLKKLRDCQLDAVLLPKTKELYPDGYRFRLSENTFSQRFCGRHRPGHFDGVLTVVSKLLNLVRADHAYFGEKDFQQLQLIKDLCESFFIDTKIVACPIVREENGLAMSSRNSRLDASDRKKAAFFHQILLESKSNEEARNKLSSHGFDVDYVDSYGDRRLAAIHFNSVRLIDNVQI